MKTLAYTLLTMLLLTTTACSSDGAFDYKEDIALYGYDLQLYYIERGDTIQAPAGLPVDMKDQMAQVFTDSTDAAGTVHFLLPPGIYDATSSSNYIDTTGTDWYRYIFNGVQSMIVVAPDKSSRGQLKLTMSKKRIVH